jgi:hypothetical protein
MVRFMSLTAGAAALVAAAGCASYPAPIQQMADAEAAARSAEDTGAAANPQAQLHLKLAQEGITQAKGFLANGDNERAGYVLLRAKSDAELALAETREQHTRVEAAKAAQMVVDLQSGAANQPSATTTTTSAVTTSPATAAPATSTMSTTTTTTGGKP